MEKRRVLLYKQYRALTGLPDKALTLKQMMFPPLIQYKVITVMFEKEIFKKKIVCFYCDINCGKLNA